MAAHFTYHTVAATLTVGLHRIADVADTLAGTSSRNALVKRLLSGGQELHHRLVHFPHGESVAAVAIVAVKLHNEVCAYYVSVLKNVVRRKTMDHDLIDLDAQRTWKALVSETRRASAVVKDEFPRYRVKLTGRDAWLHPPRHFTERARRQVACGTHLLDFFCSFEIYHF